MKLRPIQTNFSGGELDPIMHGRTDTPGYKTYLAYLQNFNADRRGSLIRRGGFEHYTTVSPLSSVARQGKIISFESVNGRAIMVIGEQYISVHYTNAPYTIETYVSPYSAGELETIQYDISPDTKVLVLACPTKPLYVLDYVLGAPIFQLAPLVGITFPAGEYPGAVKFFQGRMWLGNILSESNRMIGSDSKSYYTYTTTTPALATDCLDFLLDSLGDIKWFHGFRTLFIGLDTGENTIKSQGSQITSSDSILDNESSYGSSAVQPILVKNNISYVTYDRSSILNLTYSQEKDTHLSFDILENARHLTTAGIKEIHFAKHPLSFYIVVLNDGQMLRGDIDSTGRVGWNRILTNGYVVSATVHFNANSHDVYVLVNRNEISEPTKYSIEKLVQDVFMDSHVKITLATPGTIFGTDPGVTIDHLIGLTVQVLVKRATDPVGSPYSLIPDQTVLQVGGTGSGYVETPYDAIEVIVGLQYSSIVRTLPPTIQDGNNSIDNSMQRYSEVYFKLLDSAIPLVNGSRPNIESSADSMGVRASNISTTVTATVLGWDKGTSVEIEQDLPFATTILNIGGELSGNQM